MESDGTEFEPDLASFISFRDVEECRRVRAISRADITSHPNTDFRIAVIDDRAEFYGAFAVDLLGRIVAARNDQRQLVLILPVGPMPQYRLLARMLNELAVPLSHVHTFNMDEYADRDGSTAPLSWPGSFARAMWEGFFSLLEPALRPPDEQIHFPLQEELGTYAARIDDLGGADAVYGGIGWCGHIAFWESQFGDEYDGDLDAYRAAGPRHVELHPMTIMQNALHSFGGDWSRVPPCANTIGPAQILEARHRSFWLDGDLGGGVSWQRFIARLCAHGPVNEFVPGSLLQTVPGTYTMLGGVADNIEIEMS